MTDEEIEEFNKKVEEYEQRKKREEKQRRIDEHINKEKDTEDDKDESGYLITIFDSKAYYIIGGGINLQYHSGTEDVYVNLEFGVGLKVDLPIVDELISGTIEGVGIWNSVTEEVNPPNLGVGGFGEAGFIYEADIDFGGYNGTGIKGEWDGGAGVAVGVRGTYSAKEIFLDY